MWHKDWLDVLAVVGWIGIWSLLVYLLPYTGI
jgi:hypothetical protein